jgi:hypothetical protein
MRNNFDLLLLLITLVVNLYNDNKKRNKQRLSHCSMLKILLVGILR